jgi:hypothetical protein
MRLTAAGEEIEGSHSYRISTSIVEWYEDQQSGISDVANSGIDSELTFFHLFHTL